MIPASRHRKRLRRQSIALLCDRLVTAGLVFVIVFSPFAFGSVHPQAYGLLEIVACGLALTWIAKLRLCGPAKEGLPVAPKKIWVPLAGFLGVVLFQLVPLPPGLLGGLSPSTYAVYELALPGWPEKAPYEDPVRALLAKDDAGVQATDLAQLVALPAVDDVERFEITSIVPDAWGRLPGEPLLERNERRLLERWVGRDHAGFFASWRTLSLNPARTTAELLKILAYLAIFSVVTFYPLDQGSREDVRFQRRLLRAVAFTAIAVAAIGLLQRFSWNGKILWFFVPWDWGEPRLLHPQTSGPFVSRNNFGGYLAMTLPLVLVPLLARSRIDLKRARLWTQWLFGAGAALVATAIFFSLSRGSWVAAAASLSVLLLALVNRVPAEKRASFLRSRRAGLQVVAALAVVMLLFVLVPTGSSELGSDIDRRLEQTVSNSVSWEGRVENWRDSMPMIADFPIFGVGLSSWGSIFPKYDESFFFGSQARRAHNDYIQLVSETGVVGGLLLLGVCVLLARRLLRVLRERSDSAYAVHLAIATGLLALFLHEFVDFDLQMPAIALTAAVLLGVGLRGSWRMASGGTLPASFLPLTCAGAAIFLFFVFAQPTPRANASAPAGLIGTLRWLEQHPTDSPTHLALGVRFADAAPELARTPLDAAVALNPSSPGPRDTRAVLAAQMGNEELALADIEESMFRAPSRALHPVLTSRAVSWLPAESRAATERGFARAMDGAGYRAAVALAGFYSGFADRRAAAAAWEQAAELAPRSTAVLMRRAGWEMLQIGDLQGAEDYLRRSVAFDPMDIKSRVLLIKAVLGARGELSLAISEAEEGIQVGNDAYEIDLALAEAARISEDSDLEQRTLIRATKRRPSAPGAHFRLGLSYRRSGNIGGALRSLQETTRLAPENSSAWYHLALAADESYDFALAEQGFAKAVELAPQNAAYRSRRQRFRARIEMGDIPLP